MNFPQHAFGPEEWRAADRVFEQARQERIATQERIAKANGQTTSPTEPQRPPNAATRT